jgi:hypothetical protein
LSRGKAAAAAAKHAVHRQAVAGMQQVNKPLSATSRPGGSGGKEFNWQTMRMDIDKPGPYAREAMHAIDVFDPSEDAGNVGSGSGISHVNWWSGGKGTGKWWEHSKDHQNVATSLTSEGRD